MKRTCGLSLLAILAVSAAAAEPQAGDAWEPYRFLVGEWAGEGEGDPGKGSGRFTFAWDLQDKILVRRNQKTFPPAQGRPASTHEDIMMIYRGEDGGSTRAIYFDSEGHVIHYVASVSSDKKTVTFVSDASAKVPRFRLSYTKTADDSLEIKFEIAATGKPEAFQTYLDGRAKRKKSSASTAPKN
jgi:hypothetical protein